MLDSQEKLHQNLTEREQAVLECDKMKEAFREAIDRLEISPDYYEVMSLSINERDGEKIATFLDENKERLSEEAKFFLNTIVHVRRASARYKKIVGKN